MRSRSGLTTRSSKVTGETEHTKSRTQGDHEVTELPRTSAQTPLAAQTGHRSAQRRITRTEEVDGRRSTGPPATRRSVRFRYPRLRDGREDAPARQGRDLGVANRGGALPGRRTRRRLGHRRLDRPEDRSRPAGEPGRRSRHRARLRHQRQDHHDPAHRGRARRAGPGGHQLVRRQHAHRAHLGAGQGRRHAVRGARGGRALPRPGDRRDHARGSSRCSTSAATSSTGRRRWR